MKLDLTGTMSNADAIGAKVRVKATIQGEEIWQLREIGTSQGWVTYQSDMRSNFGLGDATVAEVVRIEWPSGIVQELFDVNADQILKVTEPPRLSITRQGRLRCCPGRPVPRARFSIAQQVWRARGSRWMRRLLLLDTWPRSTCGTSRGIAESVALETTETEKALGLRCLCCLL